MTDAIITLVFIAGIARSARQEIEISRESVFTRGVRGRIGMGRRLARRERHGEIEKYV